MDRRGFLQNIVGSLVAVGLDIPATKPDSHGEIIFKCVDLPAIVVGDPEVLGVSGIDIETCFRRWRVRP